MGDSQTDARTDTVIEASAEIAALREQLTLARDRLAERDRQLVEQDRQLAEMDRQQVELDRQIVKQDQQLAELDRQIAQQDRQLAELDRQIARQDQQQAEQERQLAELREKITLLLDEIRALKKLPKRPRMKPSGMASSEDEDTDNSASGSSGSGRSGKSGTERKKGRGPRRRNRHLHRRDVTVGLDDVPKGAVHKGYQDHMVFDIVFHAEKVTYRREVWQFPDGSRHVAPLPPGVATGREQYGPGVKALVVMLYYQCQSTIGRIVSMLNDVAWTSLNVRWGGS